MMKNENFQPREHLMQIKSGQKSQDYLPVQWRIYWFRNECPEGTIETELVLLDVDKETEEEAYVWNQEKKRSEKVIKTAKGIAVFRATVKDGKGGVATGTKMEKAAAFPDYLEKSETGSIGRALAALGYGTQFAPEMDEGHRIVDSPVERPQEAHFAQPRQPAPVPPAQQPAQVQESDAVKEPASKDEVSALYRKGGNAGCYEGKTEAFAEWAGKVLKRRVPVVGVTSAFTVDDLRMLDLAIAAYSAEKQTPVLKP